MPLQRSRQKYTGCNLKTTEMLDCALIGVCAVIRSNTVLESDQGAVDPNQEHQAQFKQK